MCGITGGIGVSAPSKVLLDAQLKSIEHRGPDDTGTYLHQGISLGMCRLAIVEIAAGKQPASNPSEKIHIVWNGEIYNYRELRFELEQRGVHCRDSSESEVVINLYLEFGLDFVNKLNGMFAIAIHDSRDKSLHLIRDRMGKKPLWISLLNDGTLFFASEVRALMLARPDRTLRTDMVAEVMQYGYINAPHSAFNEITQVPPASVLTWREGKTTTKKYWEPDFDTKVQVSYEEALKVTKKLIEESVSRRLISERPLGSFLSGGYDSTVVTAYMAKLMSEKVQTYSIGFHSSQFNEAHHAKKVANYLGTNHHEEILSPDPALVVEKISHVLDQPYADSSIVPTYLLAKFARENLIVALGGDGGDEVFGGYDRYLAAPVMQRLNPFLGLARSSLKFVGQQSFGNTRKFNRVGSQLSSKVSLAARYSSILSLAQLDDLSTLLNPNFQSKAAEVTNINQFTTGNLSSFDRMIRSDLEAYLPADLLVKADTATMANSLELRSPMLDVNVVEWGLSLPRKYKIKGFETKHILKDVARSLVPANLIDRPKMGFGIPRAEWLRTGMREMVIDTLTDTTASQRGWLNPVEVRKVIDLHMAGQDKDNLLWPMLMLELWARTWLD
ncbi:AsnB Asparagine synthase (glutamine-hydrolyzing) [Candidatus Planktophila vernalis]|uniref:asparagine synthase (glutamine-hydrolyzing) n=1 Tax=Candidatus Planktophila vernalis TaxID=1884907 RepID=UPI003CF4B7BC